MNILLIYGLLAVIPGVLLFVMAVFGADTDVGADVDVDMDVDADADVDMDSDMDIDASDFVSTPGVLSLRLILFFLVGFGLCGYLGAYFKWSLHHVVVALVGGFIAWFLGYQLLKLLYRQQSTSHVKAISFVGKQARVTVPIPKGGVGEITSTDQKTGKSIHLMARAKEKGREYKQGDIVKINSVAGGTARVE